MRITTFVYAENWRRTCAKTYQLLPRCTQNPLHGRAQVIHHLKYKRSFTRRILGIFLLHPPKKSVSGLEIIGYDIIPLCNACHENSYGRTLNKKSVHYTGVWKQKGELNNHNVAWFAWKLRAQFWLWAILFFLIK
ncbi:hypothetical protein G7B40_040385 [Aetokthonos hydrillicola Thurmond2011]|jgi:queuine/archaeosine tRNA-ribosyltransferase|uniref:Uncharacterized protein n=1 Tax=Aetokthonos hydrillicola Thurmond2011 TaxID=2712845 RepID=A0AAP5IHH6_9CYAN|nr:hypothetical protein [Aetokthonos hydrillicola]MBO3463675.1 hypothetical protein [Aetokthonos hydrillicola CCALA 1050]MDR9900747.1 hypothetical protein [Aetokthonos hydrillicola Thurmond2011]